MSARSVLGVLVTSLAAAAALAAAAEAKPAELTIALVGGDVYPVSGPPIPGGTVVIRGESIVAVGKGLPVPAGAQVIDCAGRRVTPGLIESYSRVGLIEVDQVESTDDARLQWPDPVRAAARMDDAVDPRSAAVGVARRHGVTSVVAVPAGGLIAGRSAWFDLHDTLGEGWKHAVSGPAAMHVMLGEAGAGAVGGSRATAILRLREVFADARLYSKQRAAFERRALRDLATSHLDLEALGDVLDRKLPMVVEVWRASDILAALAFAKAERIDLALIGAEEGWIVAGEIAAAGVPVIVDPYANAPSSFEQRGARSDNIALLARAGVKVAAATASTHNVSNLRFALGNAVRAGLPEDVALRAATLAPAEIYRVEKRYGSLQPGKLANVVVWTGDPFEPSSWAEVVLIRGERQSVENRQTRLRDKYKAKLGL